MGFLAMNCGWRTKTSYPSTTFLPSTNSTFTCRKFCGSYVSPKFIPTKLCYGFGAKIRAFASRNSVKKPRRQREAQNNVIIQSNKNQSNEYDGQADRSPSGDESVQDNSKMSSFDNLDAQKSITIPSRSAVLQACTATSGLIAALGVIIRQVSHVASVEGLPILDCSAEVSFSLEMWHLQLITGLVILISSCRYLLLKTWPDFAESSAAANQQVLTSLQPLDYVIVAFLPGFSEVSIDLFICLFHFVFVSSVLPSPVFFVKIDIIFLNGCENCIGTPFSWCIATIVWNQFEKCLGSCCSFWCFALGKWPKLFLCNLGNICRVCLWLCNNCILKRVCANGFTRSKQSGWRNYMELHIKAIKIE
ncbi:hypothetical protein F0562_033217 [Nyssa sinensis]|uniref:Uncharacterized protein n=1 Tax=Nyssa sinensis TaxID=561372 RepID=A0A5J5ARR6_9ASTE|nr:hypothetical protein F0562_033217 [Nyssa sinensis]